MKGWKGEEGGGRRGHALIVWEDFRVEIRLLLVEVCMFSVLFLIVGW